MNPTEIAKIGKFLEDRLMSETVREVIEQSIVNQKVGNKDVYRLAAERIAIDILKEAWKDLERFRNESEESIKNHQGNVGL